ncbi:helix-turn-helix domain-containing protein [Streptomyces sp. NPDC091292]|uniref:AraC-like ligand-binding domain-containing protein n=1 Tax=Streptomyces sp. NPDC091292 TaxID=3365991 RepID=UPI003812105F
MPTGRSPQAPQRQPLPSVVFSNLGVAPSDRLAHWLDRCPGDHAAMYVSTPHADDYLIRQHTITLGDVAIWRSSFPPVTLRRTSHLIRRSDPEDYHLSLVVRGQAETAWRGGSLLSKPGIYHTTDSSRPVEIQAGREQNPMVSIGLAVPKRSLPLPRRLADRAIGLPIPDGEGPGALLAQFLRHTVRNVREYHVTDGPRLALVAADLLAATLAHAAEREDALPPHTQQYMTVRRIKAFIQRHLDDPDLTPATVAAAHHISTGHLHRLFRTEEVTVAALIRRSRLERARTELADPRREREHIHTIAARWSLPAPEFSRAFRSVYGMTPGEYRRSQKQPRSGHGTGTPS